MRLPRDDPPLLCDDWLRPPRDDDALLRDDAPLREEPPDPPREDDDGPPRLEDDPPREDEDPPREDAEPPRPDDDAPRPDDEPPRPDAEAPRPPLLPVFFAALPRDCDPLLLLAALRPEPLPPRVLALLVLRVRVAFIRCVSMVWPRDGRGAVTQTPCRGRPRYQRTMRGLRCIVVRPAQETDSAN